MTQPPKPRTGFFTTAAMRAKIFWQLVKSVGRGRYWWLTPFLAVLVLFALLALILEIAPGAAPFVYALF